MIRSIASTTLGFLFLTSAFADAQENIKPTVSPAAKSSAKKNATDPVTVINPASEAEALGFVRENHPELAKVLESLKPMDPDEFAKAITELLQVSRSLAEIKPRNPKRYDVLLDAWKTKSRVELLAAQLAGSPSEELRSQLHTAIEAKVDAEIRRQKFELEQAEAAAKRARETMTRLETNRESIIEARYRALLPKKPARTKKSADSKPTVTPSPAAPSTKPIPPNGEDR